jgi:hypothetical protein
VWLPARLCQSSSVPHFRCLIRFRFVLLKGGWGGESTTDHVCETKQKLFLSSCFFTKNILCLPLVDTILNPPISDKKCSVSDICNLFTIMWVLKPCLKLRSKASQLLYYWVPTSQHGKILYIAFRFVVLEILF